MDKTAFKCNNKFENYDYFCKIHDNSQIDCGLFQNSLNICCCPKP